MLNSLQQKLVDMFKWLSNFLKEHNLRYYALGGTMLGAVRHNGIIPWDDDIDIGMPRSDYEKLVELLKNPVEHYVVETPFSPSSDYNCCYAKCYDLDTTLIEKGRKPLKRGVFIDIFPLDGIGDTPQECAKNFKKIERLHVLHAIRKCTFRKGRKWWKNLGVALGTLIPINTKKLAQKIDLLCKQIDFDKSVFVASLMSAYRQKEIVKKEIFGTPTPYSFEGFTVFGPEKYDEYLTHLYNDWRKLPPENKRQTAHNYVLFEPEKSYLKN